jgi:mono/diheme cytochrome c family protein
MNRLTRRIAGVIASLIACSIGATAHAVESPDWSEGASITAPRSNPYGLDAPDFTTARREGFLHALEYPLDISGVMIPWRPTEEFLNNRSSNPIREILHGAFAGLSKIKSTDDLFKRVGLHAYPSTDAEGADSIPHRGSTAPTTRMGVTVFERQGVEAFTLSCAACHSANLFGKKILGMTNRFSRANDFFVLGKKAIGIVGTPLFAGVLGATAGEADLYSRLRSRLKSVGTKSPATLGLDTSLAQVAISLSHRSDDEYASFDRHREKFPKKEPLKDMVADGKPAVWWNTKYKNRWLSDGSIVSGNPIYTNILWNEIGRGTDLHELEAWFAANPKVIEELTTAVFSTAAPRITDFFPAERISIERAKRGEIAFNQRCSGCHGTYTKAWSRTDADRLPLIERLKTDTVHYPEKTRVVNVGTDPQRAAGMVSLEKGLNPLAISKRNGIVIKVQTGYVPPPLVGIWARWPYFHNNSAPNLRSVLTAAKDRPPIYYAGEAIDREKDYDSDLGGYPEADRVPAAWKTDNAFRYDTSKPGMTNQGHEEGIFLEKGVEIYTDDQKRDLIEFLKTL